MLDLTGNGLMDSFEIFTLLAILSDSKVEDRIRFLFNLFDMNSQDSLDEGEVHVMLFTAIQAVCTYYDVMTQAIDQENSAGKAIYERLQHLVRISFPRSEANKLNCNNLITWQAEVPELQDFFRHLLLLSQE